MKKTTPKPNEIRYLAEFIERNDYFQRSVTNIFSGNRSANSGDFFWVFFPTTWVTGSDCLRGDLSGSGTTG